eukprot:3517992-Rhodomonas_salina.1
MRRMLRGCYEERGKKLPPQTPSPAPSASRPPPKRSETPCALSTGTARTPCAMLHADPVQWQKTFFFERGVTKRLVSVEGRRSRAGGGTRR